MLNANSPMSSTEPDENARSHGKIAMTLVFLGVKIFEYVVEKLTDSKRFMLIAIDVYRLANCSARATYPTNGGYTQVVLLKK